MLIDNGGLKLIDIYNCAALTLVICTALAARQGWLGCICARRHSAVMASLCCYGVTLLLRHHSAVTRRHERLSLAIACARTSFASTSNNDTPALPCAPPLHPPLPPASAAASCCALPLCQHHSTTPPLLLLLPPHHLSSHTCYVYGTGLHNPPPLWWCRRQPASQTVSTIVEVHTALLCLPSKLLGMARFRAQHNTTNSAHTRHHAGQGR